MEKLDLHSPDLTAQNVDTIAELFPNVVTGSLDTEGNPARAIDFDLLRQELADYVVEGPQERYQLDWPGRRAALFAANAPIAKTLRPDRDESVEFDTTTNLSIEGDSLDALKLLQESYLGRVKFIYIDPPYNTGHDFIYKDDFAESNADYLARSGQVSDEGARLVTNLDSNGRFHSDWLSMMYPRLKLARNLLTADGLIFISIDEIEASNLRLLCDQVFGSENLVEQVAWKNKYGSGALTRGFANVHEYVLIYSRSPITNIAAPLDDEQRKAYKLKDDKFAVRGGYLTQPLATKSKDPRPNLVYPVEWNGREIWPDKQWIWSEDRFNAARANDEIVFSEKDGKVSVRAKQYLRDEHGVERLGKPVSLLVGPYNQSGTKDLEELFETKVFDFPKPVALIKYFASFVVNGNGDRDFIMLDFFAGSGTAAHAVMQLNAEDGGNRRFIAVQMPEECPPHSEAAKAGFSTIADVARERIRRAGARLTKSDAHDLWRRDVGFRVLRVDTTNMSDVLRTPDTIEQGALPLYEDSIMENRSPEDLLFQVLVDLGLELTLPIHTDWIDGQQVFAVSDNSLIACFADSVGSPVVTAIAERRPLRAVFRDAGFSTDADRINAEQVFSEKSPGTEVKTI